MDTRDPTTIGLILAGGQARRMGGVDKAFVMLGGRTLLAHAIERAGPQVDELLINANGDPSRFASFGREVIADSLPGFLGPLAGILTGLEWMKAHRPNADWLASFPCDTPFLPRDLVRRLIACAVAANTLTAVAASGGRRHGVCAVWSAKIADTPQSVLNGLNLRKMDDFIAHLPHAALAFSAEPLDPFLNVNAPDDLARAEAAIAAG